MGTTVTKENDASTDTNLYISNFLAQNLIWLPPSSQKAQDPDFDFVGSNFKFKCPEPNGLFADPEQCDLYYVCEDNIATPELCEDGLLFDDSQRNKERCKLPHSVDCGKREFVQEPQAGIDPRCPRANGMRFFPLHF